MKKQIHLLAGAAVILLIAACSTTDFSSRAGSTNTGIVEVDPNRPLIFHLRQLPGLNIMNQGMSYSVKLPGSTNLRSDENVLFVINNVPIGRSFADVEGSVMINTVQSIELLKGPQAIRHFGDRGRSGVIVIHTYHN